jgi:hypothetical protein
MFKQSVDKTLVLLGQAVSQIEFPKKNLKLKVRTVPKRKQFSAG